MCLATRSGCCMGRPWLAWGEPSSGTPTRQSRGTGAPLAGGRARRGGGRQTDVTVVKPSSLGAMTVGQDIQVMRSKAPDGTVTARAVRSGELTLGPVPAGR